VETLSGLQGYNSAYEGEIVIKLLFMDSVGGARDFIMKLEAFKHEV